MNRHLRVLFVEDSDSDLQLMVRILKKAGFEVSYAQAENGAEMLAELQQQDWDLVISDFNLPGFNGAEALRILRGIRPEMPFIAVSSTFNERVCARMVEAGASDCLAKSSLITQLVARVNRLMGWSALSDPSDCDETAFEACQALFEEDEFNDYLFQVMTTARESLQEMERLHERGRLAAIADIAHRLKSPCCNIGARALSSILEEMEMAAQQRRSWAVTELLPEACCKLDEFQGYLCRRRGGLAGQ